MSNKGFARRDGVAATRREYREARDETAIIRHKARQQRWARRKWFSRNVEIECQLYRGEHEFPRTKTMTGYEMSIENRKLIESYSRDLDKGIERPLWTWRPKDMQKYRKLRKTCTENN